MDEVPPVPPPPPERLIGDYGSANAPGGRLTIVNQPLETNKILLEDTVAAEVEKKLKVMNIEIEENLVEENGLLEFELEIKEPKKTEEDVVIIPIKEKEKVVKPIIKLPYTPRQKKKNQHEKNFEKFLKIFKKLEINIPFSEALEKMPIYVKFMKDIISKKRSTNINPIILTETCSAILQGMKIPMKNKDRGSVTIPFTIGGRKFKKSLIDLGASVSFMSLSIYKKLGLGTVQDARMTLRYVDRSIRRSYGIMEDVLVKIDKFVFSVDFVILEMPED
ncbi:uncharacterized protein LOC127079337 [Lathyrus oleraceus]|uniref:uncharacterized protein LOC127079337 n=1 Tax=Pisum sativum TaxID=3888 RepID=UPI0021D28820|nr:uncharacterized protein LOC127079337 [Pisum sativum]